MTCSSCGTLALFCLLAVSASWASTLGTGHIGYRSRTLTSGLHEIEATDGNTALSAVVSSKQGFITCKVTDSKALLDSIVNDPGVSFRWIGDNEIRDMWRRCSLTWARSAMAASDRSAAVADPTSGMVTSTYAPDNTPFPPEELPGGAQGAGAHYAIVPGTRWCGKGNVAENYEDLGVFRETDSCCRTHDHCPFYIPALSHKYNFNNLKPWTISYCNCDTEIFHCLKTVNNTHSSAVGRMFFSVLGMQCFNFVYGQYCAEFHWSHLWCSRYEQGPMAATTNFPYTWEDEVDIIG